MSIVHGNEICGLEALENIKKFKLKGTVILIRANIEAYKENKRYLEINLNRVFPGNDKGKLEERTAFELSKYIYDCDFILDIHSSSEETEPFLLVSVDLPEHYNLAKSIGVKNYVTLGKVLKGSSLDECNGTKSLRFGVECGQHENKEAKENAKEISKNFLIALNVIEGERKSIEPKKYKIIGKIDIADKENFTPDKSLHAFKTINKDDIIGVFKNGEKLLAEETFIPILVDKQMKEELLLIAKEI